jgi:hypothetical protein
VSEDVDRTGVLLLRAWLHDGQVVARVQSSLRGEDQQARVVVGLDTVADTVRSWLQDLAETPP